MQHLWQRIEFWLRANHPAVLNTLNPGVHQAFIDALEETIDRPLPADLKEFLSIHNGQKYTHLTLFNGDLLLSAQEMMSACLGRQMAIGDVIKEYEAVTGKGPQVLPDRGVRRAWWHPGWIPVTSSAMMDHFCIDCAPASEGTEGQVIRVPIGYPQRRLVAPSFTAWIEKYVTDLENGLYEARDNGRQGSGVVKKVRVWTN